MRYLVCFAALLSAPVFAQDADTLTADDGWRRSLVASLAGNQAVFSNWQEGGVDALSGTAALDGKFDRVVGAVMTRQSLRLAYGVLQQDTLSVRKALDVARYSASGEVMRGHAIRPALSLTVRTQFAPGYDYSPDSTRYPSLVVVPGEALKISDVFSPLVLSQTAGIAWWPGGGFVARVGLGLKETLVAIPRLRQVQGNAPDQAARVETGITSELVLERPLMENVSIKSRLTSFQGFGQLGQTAPDALFETTLLLKVNRLLSVTLDTAALYDADVSPDVQLREALSVGVSIGIL